MFGLATLLVWLAALCVMAEADTLHLKDSAAISGRIIAEKEDLFVVDVGYTVLVVPKKEVLKLSHSEGAPGTQDGTVVRKQPPPQQPDTPAAQAVAVQSGMTGNSAADQSGLYSTASAGAPERSVRELVQKLGEAVVQVRTPSGQGSGFFVNEDGYLITNFHVIEGETQISVEVFLQTARQLERRIYRQVRIVAMNKFADLALLKVEDAGAPKFTCVPLGQTGTLSVGERVFAIGGPMGLERTVTEGIVSSKTRQMQGDLFLQTTAQINPGNSGGPLFNMRGEVVGVTNMKMTYGEGLGFAIPVERVLFFLNNRDAFAYDNENPNSGYRYLEPPRRAPSQPNQPNP
ncbi:MAG: trypsin-like peptidase domain-containing protein [Verrucomicrobiota bacterium]|nr:trypsin-like peptidase domain-containing protein [Verrucomicrobiota bacterium]